MRTRVSRVRRVSSNLPLPPLSRPAGSITFPSPSIFAERRSFWSDVDGSFWRASSTERLRMTDLLRNSTWWLFRAASVTLMSKLTTLEKGGKRKGLGYVGREEKSERRGRRVRGAVGGREGRREGVEWADCERRKGSCEV